MTLKLREGQCVLRTTSVIKQRGAWTKHKAMKKGFKQRSGEAVFKYGNLAWISSETFCQPESHHDCQWSLGEIAPPKSMAADFMKRYEAKLPRHCQFPHDQLPFHPPSVIAPLYPANCTLILYPSSSTSQAYEQPSSDSGP